MRTAVMLFAVAALAACNKASDESSNAPQPSASTGADGDADTHDDAADDALSTIETGKQLPEPLLAELRLRGSDADGRLLTLAPGFIATAECSDCGAPSYLWFLAVRCADTEHCEVLTELCEGKIARDGDTFVLEFTAIEGGPPEGAEVCVGYSGTFERP
jgi:hypothetical protein